MNVHGPGERRRLGVIQPPVIHEVRIGLRQRDQFAASHVVQTALGHRCAVQHLGDAVEPRKQFPDGLHIALQVLGGGKIDVRHLIIHHREGSRIARVQILSSRHLAHRQVPRLAKRAVRRDRPADGDKGILAEDDRPGAFPLGGFKKRRQTGIEFARRGAMRLRAGPAPVAAVIQMRQVNERQVRFLVAPDRKGRIGNPPARPDARHRTPVVHQIKGPARLAGLERRFALDESAVQVRRPRVTVLDQLAAGTVDRPGGEQYIDRGIVQALLPEKHRDPGLLPAPQAPHARRADQPRRLLPEPHLGRVVKVKAVGDDTVPRGRLPRCQRRLHGAGRRGQNRFQRQARSAPSQVPKRRHFGYEMSAQARDVDDQRPLHRRFLSRCRFAS